MAKRSTSPAQTWVAAPACPPAPVAPEQADVFERAIVAAGSLVLSSDRAGLTALTW